MPVLLASVYLPDSRSAGDNALCEIVPQGTTRRRLALLRGPYPPTRFVERCLQVRDNNPVQDKPGVILPTPAPEIVAWTRLYASTGDQDLSIDVDGAELYLHRFNKGRAEMRQMPGPARALANPR